MLQVLKYFSFFKHFEHQVVVFGYLMLLLLFDNRQIALPPRFILFHLEVINHHHPDRKAEVAPQFSVFCQKR